MQTNFRGRDFIGDLDPDNVESIRVPVSTADAFVREHQIAKVDLVKLDTETTEIDVLRGMEHILSRDQPDIFCEVLGWRAVADELNSLFEGLGYRAYKLTGEGPSFSKEISADDEHPNYLFTVRDAV